MPRFAYLTLIAAVIALSLAFGKTSGISGSLQATALAQILEDFLGDGSEPTIDVLRDRIGYPDEDDIPDRFLCNINDAVALIRTDSIAFFFSETCLRPSRSRAGLSRAPPSA